MRTDGDETRWLTVVGVGEDGLDGLSEKARAAINNAEVLAGGRRHHEFVPESKALRIDWNAGVDAGLDAVAERAGARVCVLATGDPLCFGIAKRLIARFGIQAMEILPAAGAFSLLAARMGWALADGSSKAVSCHAHPVSVLNRHLAPGRRLMVLTRNGETPAAAAALLSERGFGESRLTVFEHMGGEREARRDFRAKDGVPAVADLNVLAIECAAGPGARIWPEAPGLPEEAFRHDGKITKREVRAATLAKLMPMAGQTLWDIGTGSGAVAIEWLRAGEGMRAFAVEKEAGRVADVRHNANALGVPELGIIKGRAPEVLSNIPEPPDAVFVGGGVSAPGMLEAACEALPPGGRAVANGVTLEAKERLIAAHREWGGELTQIAVAKSGSVGRMTAFRPLMEVWQWSMTKPRQGDGA